MALQLEIGVDITGNAKREAQAIENSLQGITKAAKQTEPAVQQLTKAVREDNEAWLKSVQSGEAAKKTMAEVDAVMARVTQTNKGVAGTVDALIAKYTGYTSATTAATAATGLSTTAMLGLGGAFTAVTVAGVAWFALLAKSTKFYFEHAERTRDSRDALKDLERGWESFQMVVGGSILGGDFSIVRPIHALNYALGLTGGYLAYRIQETKEWIALLATIPGIGTGMRLANGLFSSPTTPTGDVNLPTPYRARDPRTGMSQEQFTAEARITRLHAELKEREDAANRATKALREHNAEIVRFWAGASPGVHLGISGGLPGWSMPVGSPLTSIGGLAPSVIYGPPSTLPGYTGIGPGGLSPVDPSFWERGGLFQQGMAQAAYGSGVGWLQQAASSGQQIAGGWSQFGRAGAANKFAGASSMAMGAIGGAQAVWGATSEGGAGSRALKGAASGAMVGTMIFPGVGTAIGAGVGALVGAIRGWLAPTEYEKRTKDEALNRAQATEILGKPGLERMWNAVGPGNTPFDFAFLKTQAQHDPNAVKGYLDDMLAKHERLQAAMEKYGISWEQLGAKAKQSQIDQMAEDLILDFDVLLGAGADVNLIIEKMGGHINEFVDSAIRTGSEVPAAMRPMIEKMKEMGILTADLEDISWAKTMTQGFDAIVEAINRVAKGLGVDIPAAAGAAADAITDIPAPPPFPDYFPDGGYPGGGSPQPEYAHTGGYLWQGRVLPVYHRGGQVRDEFPIWAQSGEFMMSRAAVNRIGVSTLSAMNSGRGGRPIEIRVPVNLDRRTVTELIAKTVLAG
jgi:hypothetical protein